MPHAHEARGQHVRQEPADELDRRERHGAAPAAVGVVLPAEGDLTVREADQAAVADGRTVRVPRQVLQDHLGPALERRLGVHEPFGADGLCDQAVKPPGSG
jgi:hypothetical protein